MKKHFLMLTTAASILATAGASAQEDTDNPVMQQSTKAKQERPPAEVIE